jgi:hypothetical protein
MIAKLRSSRSLPAMSELGPSARKTAKPPVSQAIGACIVWISRKNRYQTRPRHRNAGETRRCNDRSDHGCNGLATFRARLSCRRRAQEARAKSRFGSNKQGAGLSHQGWQSFACSYGLDPAGGLRRYRKNVATAVPQPKGPLRTRSRICAVLISVDYAHAGGASFRNRPPTHLTRHLLFAVIAYRLQHRASRLEARLLLGSGGARENPGFPRCPPRPQ